MDISRHTLQKLHTVEYPKTNIDIYVNKADPTTFLLDDNESSRICKIVDQTIIIDERLENKFTSCFYNKCVYTLEFYYRDDQDRDLVSLLYKCLVNIFTALDTSNLYIQCRRKDRKSIRFRITCRLHTQIG
jgi:hypothetical protein